MAPHSSILAWKIPWTEEPSGLQSMGLWRVRHNWATSLSRIGEGNGNPLKCSCLENPRDGGAWWAAIYGVAQSRTRLKRLSSSSSKAWKGLSNLLKISQMRSKLELWTCAMLIWNERISLVRIIAGMTVYTTEMEWEGVGRDSSCFPEHINFYS